MSNNDDNAHTNTDEMGKNEKGNNDNKKSKIDNLHYSSGSVSDKKGGDSCDDEINDINDDSDLDMNQNQKEKKEASNNDDKDCSSSSGSVTDSKGTMIITDQNEGGALFSFLFDSIARKINTTIYYTNKNRIEFNS